MVDMHVVSVEELRPVLAVLTNLQWPIPFEQAPSIVEQRGWSMFGKKTALSTLPVSLQIVGLNALDGYLSRVDFRVSDTVTDADDVERQALMEAYQSMVDTVTICLGFKPTGPLWVDPGVKWDLPTGGRINLYRGTSTVSIEVWSPELSKVEQRAIAHGIDPERTVEEVDSCSS